VVTSCTLGFGTPDSSSDARGSQAISTMVRYLLTVGLALEACETGKQARVVLARAQARW
jgi:hypothetical protein